VLPNSSEAPLPVRVISEAIGGYLAKLGPVWIEGELSEVNIRPGSSMVFMRLRDSSADLSLSVMCHRSVIDAIQPLAPNARVVMYSKVSWYAKSGSLSMNAKEIRAVGVGELLARLEHLKSVLNTEGLFAASRKRALPFLPKVVGLICGRNSDAEKDVIENARRRWPAVQFEIREVAVQGAAVVIEVTQALKELEANVDVDVIIITRGGGSFEDLLPFSDEGLVRLVAECSTPIVSAIGHEKDAPLLDLVADFRASTPTDAGKAVVPDMDEELEKISALRARAHRYITHWIERELQGLAHVRSRPIFADPQVMITSRAERVAHDRDRAARAFSAALSLAREEISSLASQVRTLSPQATLDRGYAVVQLQDGSVVRDGAHVQPGDHMAIRVARGVIAATADAALVSE